MRIVCILVVILDRSLSEQQHRNCEGLEKALADEFIKKGIASLPRCNIDHYLFAQTLSESDKGTTVYITKDGKAKPGTPMLLVAPDQKFTKFESMAHAFVELYEMYLIQMKEPFHMGCYNKAENEENMRKIVCVLSNGLEKWQLRKYLLS